MQWALNLKFYSGHLLVAVNWGLFLEGCKSFYTWKAIVKSQTLCLQSCFIHMCLASTEISFIQEVTRIYTSLFLVTDYLKITLQAWNIFGTLKKRALWSVLFIYINLFFPLFVCFSPENPFQSFNWNPRSKICKFTDSREMFESCTWLYLIAL